MIQLRDNTLELFITDPHWPLADPEVVDLELQVAKDLKPALIWFNGDNVDFKSISRFRTDPKHKYKTRAHIQAAEDGMRAFRKASANSQIVFKEGNHDLRLQNYIIDKADELSDFEELRLPYLLHLNDWGCKWVANDHKLRVGQLWHLHGNEIPSSGVNPARRALQRVNDNVIFGHIHKFSVAHQRNLGGTVKVAWSVGCTQVMDVDFSYHPEWDQGFAIIEYTRHGLFHVNPIEVFKVDGHKHCIVHGKLYRARG